MFVKFFCRRFVPHKFGRKRQQGRVSKRWLRSSKGTCSIPTTMLYKVLNQTKYYVSPTPSENYEFSSFFFEQMFPKKIFFSKTFFQKFWEKKSPKKLCKKNPPLWTEWRIISSIRKQFRYFLFVLRFNNFNLNGSLIDFLSVGCDIHFCFIFPIHWESVLHYKTP